MSRAPRVRLAVGSHHHRGAPHSHCSSAPNAPQRLSAGPVPHRTSSEPSRMTLLASRRWAAANRSWNQVGLAALSRSKECEIVVVGGYGYLVGPEWREDEEEAAKIRDRMREEKRREREREMRMSNMGQEQRAKMLARQQNRDISEKIALGLAKPTLSKESMLDSRLFNQESLSGTFADDEAYNLYDRPLFHGSSAAAAIYKARGNITEGNEESFGGGTAEGIGRALDNDRFGLGQAKVGFEGAQDQEVREGPVQFEKDTGDVFGLDKFLDEAKSGRKRGLDTEVGGSRKKQQLDKASERE
ncbi:hypothetical protein NM688_g6072 [Phlebia brevispora]|uniref:Uncharacterized protein n=1 Tax=Phlebia brevispora TaxID=194682 RepID=A0ACC1SKB4_9APHY|nr:hypothetical protein NM688_g6072 [Phlebia brevispora]